MSNNINLFEIATREGYRFEAPQLGGKLTIEDLWQLPLTAAAGRASLDEVAKTIARQIKAGEEESFVKKNTPTNQVLVNKLELVKHIITVKQEEADKAATAKAKREQKNKLLEALDAAENKELSGKSADEIRKMLAELEG